MVDMLHLILIEEDISILLKKVIVQVHVFNILLQKIYFFLVLYFLVLFLFYLVLQ